MPHTQLLKSCMINLKSKKIRFVEINKLGELVKIHDNPDYPEYQKSKNESDDFE